MRNPSRTHWYEYDSMRLVIEKNAMQERYPGFVLRKLDDGRLAWIGKITTNNNNTYQIAVIYPYSFPNQPPEVYPIEPTIEVVDVGGQRYKHQYRDGHLCLYYPADRTFSSNSTAATIVTVAAAWFFAYEYWLASGKREWPGVEAD
jgi:hypothetical protein